jgi:molybdopterin-binding protein
MSVRQNIAYGLSSGTTKTKSEEVEILAEELEITHLLDRKPETLSGGEGQRVALARTLATKPECLLLDEPISSLDTGSRADMRGLLRKLNRKNITMLHVTHDYEEAVSLASRIGIMEHGSIVQIDTPQNIFHHPESEFVADFIGIKNFFGGRITRRYNDTDNSADFEANGLRFLILTNLKESIGNIIIRSEDVSISMAPFDSSIRNTFEGTIIDIFPVRVGMEVVIDIGLEIAALITHKSIDKLNLACGKKVYVNMKASAIKFLGIKNGA